MYIKYNYATIKKKASGIFELRNELWKINKNLLNIKSKYMAVCM